MKKLIFIFILVYGVSIHAQSEYTLCSTVEKEGISLEEYGALLFADSCTFYVADVNGRKITPDSNKWTFEIAEEAGSWIIEKDIVSLNNYGLKIDTRLKEQYPNNYKRYTLENDSSVYYLGRVIFEGSYGKELVKLEKEFYINLLPSIPKVKVLGATWSNYDEQWNIYDDGMMTLQISCFNSTTIGIFRRDIWNSSHIIVAFYFKPNIDEEKGIGTYDFWDADTYLRFGAGNPFGSVTSKDTLWVSEVMSSIITSLPTVQQSDRFFFYPNPVTDWLYVSDREVFPVEIYDSCGKLINKYSMPISAIDVSTFKEGIYLLIYQDKIMGRRKAFKMIKKNGM